VVVEHLERSRDAFLAATAGLSDAQYQFRAADGTWSIAEIVEHVAVAERRILDFLATMPGAAAPTGAKRDGPERFARLAALIPAPDQRRLEAPTPLRPTNAFGGAEAALAAFVDARRRAVAVAHAAPADVCDRVLPHRLLGELDLEEWLWFVGLHSLRHVAQIEAVKRAPGYPA
jgi:hypothetical protein